jgi:hypothetical protein
MTIYRCEFQFPRGEIRPARSSDGIDAFRNGFWIDKDYQYTKGGDNVYWIPPTRILYIQKEKPPNKA